MQQDRFGIAVDSSLDLPIVVSGSVWKDIKSSTPDFIESVRQCIYKIARRQFDFGLRVKKLVGVDRHVWEARIDRASRLLFTYRQSQDSNGQSYKLVAIEAICVDHDDVSRRAKSIDLNYWEGEEIKVLGNLDREFNMLDANEQEEIEHLWYEEVKIHSDSIDELLGNIKWSILEPQIIESQQEWQETIERGGDLRLRLTPEESELIDTYGNILVSGSAGTGKTTVGLYRLARTMQMNPEAKYLYTAYNPILVKESREQFKQLLGNPNGDLPANLDFLTIQDLCLKITQDCGAKFDRTLVSYPEFYSRYKKRPESKKYPAFLIWDEIRSIIKGGNLKEHLDIHLLNLKDYIKLGRNRSGVISETQRDKIYHLALWYQKYLNSNKLADEIDLTRVALWASKKNKYNPYTSIFCDEVQDFTEIQLELLIGLLAKDGQILCAGDINQMIAPSGFRWEDLTTRLYSKDRKWNNKTLSFNFRSTGNLVSLSLKLLNLKAEILKDLPRKEEIPKNTNGELARILQVSINDVNRIELGAADAILVRTEERKHQLREQLQTVLIFTIEESKGLEFDTVYLIDFFEKSQDLWNAALHQSKILNDKQKPELRLEFNLLYVAITRARRLLNICEVETSALWKHPALAESVLSITADEVLSQVQPVNDRDWYERAIYYRDARLLPQALECAIKSTDKDLQKDIEIEYLVSTHKYTEAAQLLLDIHKYSEAAELYEKIFDWQQASKAWALSGDLDKATNCEVEYLVYNCQKREAIRVLVEREKYVEAAKLLQELGDFEKATELFLKGDAKELAIACQSLLLKQIEKINISSNKNKLIQSLEIGNIREDFIETNSRAMPSQAVKASESDNYSEKIELFSNICDFLEYARNKEAEIAKAIFKKYGTEYIAGSYHIDNYHYMESGIFLKRQGLYDLGIEKYSMFFDKSKVGKSWYMTYYGVAKILTLSKQYELALSSLTIAIELCKITRCADSTYLQQHHLKKITALKNGKNDREYLSSIKG